MKTFNEHESVIYTDARGRQIDTFVVFDTDESTGLTHINHMNLKVPVDSLELHPASIAKYNLPMQDAFSFEIFKKLKDKFKKPAASTAKRDLNADEPAYQVVLKKAS